MTEDAQAKAREAAVAPLHGWLILDKPVGLGSTQAVWAVKRALRQAGVTRARVGHGGTLDPLASGVLPIAIGEATKLAGRMLDADKAYEFTVQFGRQTDTLDADGRVVATSAEQPGFGPVETVLSQRFMGEITQVPPAYSAIKVGGERAYDRARAGKSVDLAPRRVTIHGWRYIQEGFVDGDSSGEQYATLEVRVSKGTYIRSLARDIALALGTVGHVTMLRRTKAGPFTLAQAVSLDKLAGASTRAALQALLLPLTAGLDDIPVLALTPDQATALRCGRRLEGAAAAAGLHLALLGTVPVALVDAGKVVRGFTLMSE